MIVAAEDGNKLHTVHQELLNLAVYSSRIHHHEDNQTQRYETAGACCTQVSGKKCSDLFRQEPEGTSGQPQNLGVYEMIILIWTFQK
jgi:hypothetical protein